MGQFFNLKSLVYIFTILITACGQKSNKPNGQTDSLGNKQIATPPQSPFKKVINFNDFKGKAVLIGDKIEVLNDELEAESSINERSIVEIIGISDSLFQNTVDKCRAFKYVKIRFGSQNGIIDGRNVHQITASEQDTSFYFKNKKFSICGTTYFGIGVSDDEGLTFCSNYHEPVVLIEGDSNQPKLIELVQNDISKKVTSNKVFKYFELMANDGAYDKIKKITPTNQGVILTIKREFQEGWNEYQVRLSLLEENYKAEYISYGKIKY
jgi:hypothetical protein